MNSEQRSKASIDQIEHFFSSYSATWRYAKILINEKILNDKYAYLKDIAITSVQNPDRNPESLIAQELTSGLQFDSLANCVQYVEDLFALLSAGKKKDYFIRNIITYGTGPVENLIKQPLKDEELCKLFYIPNFKDLESEDFHDTYKNGLTELHAKLNSIKEFYKMYHFFYIQYKHGLTVALKPYGEYNSEQIAKDKAEKRRPYLVAFDNLAISKVFGNKYRFQNIIMMPHMTPNTQPFLQALEKEDNLTRYVTAPGDLTFDAIKECANLVRSCMCLFINNFLLSLRDNDPLEVQLPTQSDKVVVFKFPLEFLKSKH